MTAPARPLAILLASGDHERAHAAFLVAAGAAALGRPVTVFATGAGLHALCTDISPLSGAGRDAVLAGRGVAGLVELRDAARSLGVRLLACDAGLRGEAIEAAALVGDVTVAGVATFLVGAGEGDLVAL